MFSIRQDRWRIAVTVTIAAAVAACAEEAPGPTGPDAALGLSAAGAPVLASQSEHLSQVAQVRALTAKYRRFEAAMDAGYDFEATGCRSNEPIGAMGIHWLNLSYLDAAVTPLEPEIVIYEPGKNGKMSFVGVEYIVPFTMVPETDPAPELFGQEFLKNFGDQLWMMHLWVGRHNPDGLFATWNPRVTCAYAE
jgi:hypothetical protein